MFRFGWSQTVVGASLAFIGLVMATSQATLPRLLVPRIGEARSAMLGLSIGTLGFLGYGFATEGWMMFALLVTWFFGAAVMPSTNALMSRRVPRDSQGELQGGVASLYALSSIVAPPIMTQLFSYSSRPNAPVHLPGAAFLFATILGCVSLALFRRASRVHEAVHLAQTPVAEQI